MTITTIWADGAENFATVAGTSIDTIMQAALWDGAGGITLSTDPRTGLYSFFMRDPEAFMRRTFQGDQTDVKAMFSAKYATLPDGVSAQFAHVQIRNFASQPILTVQVLPTGRIRVLDYQNVQLAVSTREIASGVHNHFELNFSASHGYFHMRVNGNDNFIVSASGNHSSTFLSKPDADPGSDPGLYAAAELAFGGYNNGESAHTSNITYDDIAAFSIAEGDATTYLGLYGVYYLKPNADGHYNDFSRSTGSTGFNLVNEIPPDGDTSFVYENTSGTFQSFAVEALPANVTNVYSVLPIAYSKKTDAGPGSVQIGVRHGGTDGLNGDDLPLLTNYSYLTEAFDAPPDGGSWSPTSLPEIVIKRTV